MMFSKLDKVNVFGATLYTSQLGRAGSGQYACAAWRMRGAAHARGGKGAQYKWAILSNPADCSDFHASAVYYIYSSSFSFCRRAIETFH